MLLNALNVKATLSADKNEILEADRVIFPGVGEASSAMQKLKDTGLNLLIPELKQPVLGILLGNATHVFTFRRRRHPRFGYF